MVATGKGRGPAPATVRIDQRPGTRQQVAWALSCWRLALVFRAWQPLIAVIVR